MYGNYMQSHQIVGTGEAIDFYYYVDYHCNAWPIISACLLGEYVAAQLV